jgi:hypothetical protein
MQPISTAEQKTALNLKANLASPSISGGTKHFNQHFNKLMLIYLK